MYTISDYNDQVATVRESISTLRDIVDEFIELWQGISSSIDDLDASIDEIPTE